MADQTVHQLRGAQEYDPRRAAFNLNGYKPLAGSAGDLRCQQGDRSHALATFIAAAYRDAGPSDKAPDHSSMVDSLNPDVVASVMETLAGLIAESIFYGEVECAEGCGASLAGGAS